MLGIRFSGLQKASIGLILPVHWQPQVTRVSLATVTLKEGCDVEPRKSDGADEF